MGVGEVTIKVLSPLVLLVTIALLLAGHGDQRYTIRAMNEGNEKLSEVRVWYGKLMTEFGYLSPSVFKAKSLMRHPPPDVAEVSWTDASGTDHRVEVDISGVVPRKYDEGVLSFVIHADRTVTAGFFIPEKLPFESIQY